MNATVTRRTSTAIFDDINQVDDRSAGRWCAECQQHGGHHSDKHDEFMKYRENLVEELAESFTAEGCPVPNWEHQSADEPRYDIDVAMAGCGTSMGAVISHISRGLRAHNVAQAELTKFAVDMMSGTYNDGLVLMETWVFPRFSEDD